MHFLELIAERKIAEAEREGALRDLPGAGAPLDLGGDPLIPEDLRMAYRILKNAGLAPPEVAMLREIGQLEALVRDVEGEEQMQALRRLELVRMQLDAAAPGRAALLLRDAYRQKLVERFAGGNADAALPAQKGEGA
jgi:hypothetical protein